MEMNFHDKKYISVPDAAKRLEIPRMTMYRWAKKGKTGRGDALDAIKDSLTNHYFIAEESIERLLSRYSNRLQAL